MYKLVTTVPEKDADHIREVLAEAGAGKVGNYILTVVFLQRELEGLKEMKSLILELEVNFSLRR